MKENNGVANHARTLICFFGSIVAFSAFSALDSSWIKYSTHEGCYTNGAIWSKGYVPTNALQAVQINTGNLGDFRFTLSDWQTKVAYHMLLVYPGSTLTFDGVGTTFESPALTEAEEGLYNNDPSIFSIQTGASVPKTKLLFVTYGQDPATGKTRVPTWKEPQYRFENIYLSITNTSAYDVTMDFARGTFDFDNGGDAYRVWQFGTGMLETDNKGGMIRSERVRFHPGTSLAFNNLRLNGMACSNTVDYTIAGSTVSVATDLYIDGLANVAFTDGAQVSAKTIGKSFSGNALDNAVMTIDGAATRVSTTADFFIGFKGCGSLSMRGGRTDGRHVFRFRQFGA